MNLRELYIFSHLNFTSRWQDQEAPYETFDLKNQYNNSMPESFNGTWWTTKKMIDCN